MNSQLTVKAGARALQRAATRRDLIAAGLRVVAENGFADATTAAIARETGKAHGTVFVHFPTREALVVELINAIGSTITARLAAIPSGGASLSQVLDTHLAALHDHEILLCRMLRETALLPPAARALLFAFQSGVAARIRAGLDHDIGNGTARAFDPVALANIWISLTNHYLINRDLFAPGANVIAAEGETLKRHLMAIVEI